MSVASTDDVAVALGRLFASNEEEDQAQWWLDGVELVITERLGDVNSLDQTALRYVEAEAVADKVRRNGVLESSVTVTVDDATVTRRYEGAATADDIAAEWWALLGHRLARAKSMRLTGWC